MSTSTATRKQPSAQRLSLYRRNLQTVITLAVLVTMVTAFSLLSERFLTWDNLRNVARGVAPLMIVSCAGTLVMIARGLDLSVGSVVAVTAVFAAYFASHGVPLWVAFTGAVCLGTLVGMVNGIIVVFLRVSPIIATLGTLNIGRGVAYLITPSAILVGLPSTWSNLGTSSVGPIPTPVIIAAVVFLVFQFLLMRTVFGRHVYAIGGNEETAVLSGVDVNRVLLILYALSGAMAGLAGIVLASRLGSGDPNIGSGFEFQVIVSIILGGTSLAGGEGRLIGTIIGVLIMGFLGNGLNLVGVEPFWQYVAQGVVLVFAVAVDRLANTGVLSLTSRRVGTR